VGRQEDYGQEHRTEKSRDKRQLCNFPVINLPVRKNVFFSEV
jgi:hypothetical protein